MNKLKNILLAICFIAAFASCDDREEVVSPNLQDKPTLTTAAKDEAYPYIDSTEIFFMLGVSQIERGSTSDYVVHSELGDYDVEIVTDNFGAYVVSFESTTDVVAYRFNYENNSIENGYMSEANIFYVTNVLLSNDDSVYYQSAEEEELNGNFMFMACISHIKRYDTGIDVPIDAGSNIPGEIGGFRLYNALHQLRTHEFGDCYPRSTSSVPAFVNDQPLPGMIGFYGYEQVCVD